MTMTECVTDRVPASTLGHGDSWVRFAMAAAMIACAALSAHTARAAILLSEDFNSGDGGFTVSNTGPVEGPWTYDTGGGSWGCHGGPSCVGPYSSALTSPAIPVGSTAPVTLSFDHRYSFEYDGWTRWDGGQVRLSVTGGAFAPVPGSAFSANGYVGIIEGNNVLNGQDGFNDDSPGYSNPAMITSVAGLGSFSPGDTIQVQFLGGWDECAQGIEPNWEIDAVTVIGQTPSGNMVPVPTAGYNRDVIVESTAVPPFADFASALDVPNAYSFYEAGLPGGWQGLPPSRTFTSLADGTTVGELQPYDGANVLFLDSQTPTGTLTFLPGAQVPYPRLAIFAASANSVPGAQGSLVIHFTDGTDSPQLFFDASDWFGGSGYALTDLGRVSVFDDLFDVWNVDNPRIYQTTLDLASMGLDTRAIESIEFTMPAQTETTGVFGVSGEAGSVEVIPEPATLSLLSVALGGLGLLGRRRRA